MNKLGKGPNLTWLFIGVVIAVLVMVTSFSNYATFITDNDGNLSDTFTSVQGQVESTQPDLEDIGTEASSLTKITQILKSAAASSLVVFVTGLSAVGELFQLGTVVTSLFNIGKEAIPGLNALFGALILISVFFIGMSLIKARRGTGDRA